MVLRSSQNPNQRPQNKHPPTQQEKTKKLQENIHTNDQNNFLKPVPYLSYIIIKTHNIDITSSNKVN